MAYVQLKAGHSQSAITERYIHAARCSRAQRVDARRGCSLARQDRPSESSQNRLSSTRLGSGRRRSLAVLTSVEPCQRRVVCNQVVQQQWI